MKRTGVATTVALMFCLFGVAAAPAAAAPAWLSPIDLSAAGDEASEPQVAVDPAGNAVAVWTNFDGDIIESAARLAGGSWSAPSKLSGQDAGNPQVAVDPAGNAVAVWSRFNGTNLVVESASLSLGGSWSNPTELSPAGREAAQSQVAVDSSGNALTVWSSHLSTDLHSVIESSSHPAGGSWSDPTRLSGPDAVEPGVAVDPAGNAVAIWQRFNGTKTLIESAALLTGGSWSDPVGISADKGAIQPEVAVDPAGNAVAIWNSINGPNFIVESSSHPAGGSWSDPTKLSAPGERIAQSQLVEPQVAVDSSGNAAAVWSQHTGTDLIIESASLSSGGGWSKPKELSAAGREAVEPQVAVDPAGNAVAIWNSINAPNFIESSSLPPGGGWSQPTRLSGNDAVNPQAAVDSSGNALAIWGHFNGPKGIIQAAAFDATPPQVRGLTVPKTAAVGQRLGFSVSPFDIWSPLGQTHWDFGDGGSATSAKATYSYAKPGSYKVTLSAADAVANTASASASVAIWQVNATSRLVKVKRGRALLGLSCRGTGLCKGTVRLSYGKKKGKRRVAKLGIGSFVIATTKHKTIPIKLSAKAKRLLAKAPRKGLSAKLGGLGVKVGTVRLIRGR